jgi:hypothetical protein
MDFWSDQNQSAYRPAYTVKKLFGHRNFTYQNDSLVLKFESNNNGVRVCFLNLKSNTTQWTHGKNLVLGSGVLGTARIVLRSLKGYNTRVPIISNAFCYLPCLQPSRLGSTPERLKSSLSQLILCLDEDRKNRRVTQASLYTYRSLLLFKLIKESPLNFADSRRIFQQLSSAFIIAGIFFPEESSQEKYLELIKDSSRITEDYLKAVYSHSDAERSQNANRERAFRSTLRKLGCWPLMTMRPDPGAGIHYAGTLPFSLEPRPLSISPQGELYGTKGVYVVDGSGFKFLPGKGLTFTLMANAFLVAKHVIKYGKK